LQLAAPQKPCNIATLPHCACAAIACLINIRAAVVVFVAVVVVVDDDDPVLTNANAN